MVRVGVARQVQGILEDAGKIDRMKGERGGGIGTFDGLAQVFGPLSLCECCHGYAPPHPRCFSLALSLHIYGPSAADTSSAARQPGAGGRLWLVPTTPEIPAHVIGYEVLVEDTSPKPFEKALALKESKAEAETRARKEEVRLLPLPCPAPAACPVLAALSPPALPAPLCSPPPLHTRERHTGCA